MRPLWSRTTSSNGDNGRNSVIKGVMECNQRIQDSYHGSAGPITVSDHCERNPLSLVYVEAAQEIGIALNSDFNGAVQEGCGFYQLTCRDGQRCSAADGYLTPILGRPNLKVVTHAHATRVLIEGSRAVGMEYLSPRQGLERQHAAGEVLLCAGAINSPQLLMLSGIGPADELKRLGVDVRLELPGVGSLPPSAMEERYERTVAFDGRHSGTFDLRSPSCLRADAPSPLALFATFNAGEGLRCFLFVSFSGDEASPGPPTAEIAAPPRHIRSDVRTACGTAP